MLGGGVTCIGIAFLSSDGTIGIIKLVIAIIGKMFVSIAYGIMWIWSSEVYPTNIRSVGVGMNQFVSKLGTVTMPWISKHLIIFYQPLPFLVMGVLSFIGGIIACVLPETNGVDLPDVTVVKNNNEAETLTVYRDNRFSGLLDNNNDIPKGILNDNSVIKKEQC